MVKELPVVGIWWNGPGTVIPLCVPFSNQFQHWAWQKFFSDNKKISPTPSAPLFVPPLYLLSHFFLSHRHEKNKKEERYYNFESSRKFKSCLLNYVGNEENGIKLLDDWYRYVKTYHSALGSRFHLNFFLSPLENICIPYIASKPSVLTLLPPPWS